MTVVLFDGRCRVCSGLARWLRARPGLRGARIVPNQAPGAAEEFGLTRRQVDQEIWFIDDSGRKLAGAAAVNAILRKLGGAWSLAASPGALPSAARLEERAYAWFSRNRGRFAFLAGPAEWPGGEAGPSPVEGDECGCGAGRTAMAPAPGAWRWAGLWVGALAIAAVPSFVRRLRLISRRERKSWARRRGNPPWPP